MSTPILTPASTDIPQKSIATNIDNYVRLLDEGRTAIADYERLRVLINEQEEHARQTLADTIRAGSKPVPDDGALEQTRTAYLDAEKRVHALSIAIDDAERDLAAAIAHGRPAALKELRARERVARDAYGETIAQLRAAHLRVREVQALAAWLTTFDSGATKARNYRGAGHGRVEGVVNPANGDTYVWEDVAALLEVDARPPTRAASPHPAVSTQVWPSEGIPALIHD